MDLPKSDSVSSFDMNFCAAVFRAFNSFCERLSSKMFCKTCPGRAKTLPNIISASGIPSNAIFTLRTASMSSGVNNGKSFCTLIKVTSVIEFYIYLVVSTGPKMCSWASPNSLGTLDFFYINKSIYLHL